MAKKIQKTLLFLLIIINCNFIDNNDETSFKQTGSEEILIEIMESYKDFSAEPEKAIKTIWSHAHEDNKAVTGPIERFGVMLTSEPYNAIINLTDYSFEVLQEDDQTIQYEIKINFWVRASQNPSKIFPKTHLQKHTCPKHSPKSIF